jgi:hypothetical protein
VAPMGQTVIADEPHIFPAAALVARASDMTSSGSCPACRCGKSVARFSPAWARPEK